MNKAKWRHTKESDYQWLSAIQNDEFWTSLRGLRLFFGNVGQSSPHCCTSPSRCKRCILILYIYICTYIPVYMYCIYAQLCCGISLVELCEINDNFDKFIWHAIANCPPAMGQKHSLVADMAHHSHQDLDICPCRRSNFLIENWTAGCSKFMEVFPKSSCMTMKNKQNLFEAGAHSSSYPVHSLWKPQIVVDQADSKHEQLRSAWNSTFRHAPTKQHIGQAAKIRRAL